MSQENVGLVQSVIEAHERGDFATVFAAYDPGIEWHLTPGWATASTSSPSITVTMALAAIRLWEQEATLSYTAHGMWATARPEKPSACPSPGPVPRDDRARPRQAPQCGPQDSFLSCHEDSA